LPTLKVGNCDVESLVEATARPQMQREDRAHVSTPG
jgi:hypothetical protein